MESKPVTVRPRNELDFLREESDNGHQTLIRVGAGVLCAIACGAFIFFGLKPSGAAESKPVTSVQDGGPARKQNVPTRARLVSEPRFVAPVERSQSYWVQQWDVGGDLISNARGGRNWTSTSPVGRTSAEVPARTVTQSLVKLDRVEMSLVALPNGYRRVVGRADVVNGSNKNVVDYRCELLWGPYEYAMIALQGNSKKLKPVDQLALKPGKRVSIQLVSQKIKGNPGGSPNTVRLTAWLDGEPGNNQDEYQLQFGH